MCTFYIIIVILWEIFVSASTIQIRIWGICKLWNGSERGTKNYRMKSYTTYIYMSILYAIHKNRTQVKILKLIRGIFLVIMKYIFLGYFTLREKIFGLCMERKGLFMHKTLIKQPQIHIWFSQRVELTKHTIE